MRKKRCENRLKHDVSFFDAQHAFQDPNRLIAETWITAQMCYGITVLVEFLMAS